MNGAVRKRLVVIKSQLLIRPRIAVIAPGVAMLAFGLGVGLAAGAIPDGGGVIHSCYQTHSGRLRVIDPAIGQSCAKPETTITWNQQGPKGDPGPNGPQGIPGPKGPPGSGNVTVYKGDIKGPPVVLGPQSNPTHIVDTPPLPKGTYLVSYSVGFVFGPADNAVCAAGLKSAPASNDGVFGVGGNGATESGSGAGGVYGNGVAFDTITVAKNNDRISIYCNSGQGDKGTYSGGATIIATPVGTLVTDDQ